MTEVRSKKTEGRSKERFTNAKGFTLIELAIVLVIIGIILGAVLKGQDLIEGARHKKFIIEAGKKWETAAWTYLDRKGRFPGDSDKDGIIGDGDPMTDLTGAGFISPPTSPVYLGSYKFNVYLGNDNDGSVKKNILVICGVAGCDTAFTADELPYVEAMDTAIDGVSDGAAGQVLAATAATVNASKWLVTAATASGTWTAGTTKALAYYFDRKK